MKVPEASRTPLRSTKHLTFCRPLHSDYESMPIGGGAVGGMIWNENGLTIQLQRDDSFPDYFSAGRLTLPSLAEIPGFAEGHGWLDLETATWHFLCGDLHLRCLVLKGTDLLVIEGEGAAAGQVFEAAVELWDGSPDWYFRRSTDGASDRAGISDPLPRHPQTFQSDDVVGVWELFPDSPVRTSYRGDQGFVGQPRHGVGLAIMAEQGFLQASADGPLRRKMSFEAGTDRSFRLLALVAGHSSESPEQDIVARLKYWNAGEARVAAEKTHREWWARFWRQSFVALHSPNGEADYLETIRHVFLYCLASSSHKLPPGTGGGSTSTFKFNRDWHEWGTTIYHWNTRNLYFATLAAGCFDLRKSYNDLYLDRMEYFKKVARVCGRRGLLVPEIIYAGGIHTEPKPEWDDGTFVCGINTNSLELCKELYDSWRYASDDFPLEKIYPFLRETAIFWLARKVEGSDGKFHFLNATAGETFIHADDPAPILAGLREAIPIILSAATTLDTDLDLREKLAELLQRLPDLPWDEERGKYASILDEPTARRIGKMKNVENRELDAVFPYDLGHARSEDAGLWRTTHARRLFDSRWTWHTDALVAARLGLAGWHGSDGVVPLLLRSIERFQAYPCGLASFDFTAEGDDLNMPYMEWSGLASSLAQEVVLQERSGVMEIFPAMPMKFGWEGAFHLHTPDECRIASRIEKDGTIPGVLLQSRAAATVRLRNPWPGRRVRLSPEENRWIEGETLEIVLPPDSEWVLSSEDATPPLAADLLRPPNYPASSVKHLGKRSLGLSDGPILPDLSIISASAQASQTNTIRLDVLIENRGPVPSSPVEFAVAGDGCDRDLETTAETTIPKLEVGATHQLSLEIPFHGTLEPCDAVRVLRIEIDPYHREADANRTNQFMIVPISVN